MTFGPKLSLVWSQGDQFSSTWHNLIIEKNYSYIWYLVIVMNFKRHWNKVYIQYFMNKLFYSSPVIVPFSAVTNELSSGPPTPRLLLRSAEKQTK